MDAETPTTTSPTSSEMRAPASRRDHDVAAELVEPEQMRGAGALEAQRQRLRRRVVRGQQRRQQRRRHRHHHQRESQSNLHAVGSYSNRIRGSSHP